mgnify:CR=1 FL=1
MKKILIIGAGAMGSAFSVPCLENRNDVSLIGTFLENDLIKSLKEKNNYHPALNINLPKNLNIERHDQIENLTQSGVDFIVAGISSVGIEWFANEISKFYNKKTSIILLTKGLAIDDDHLITLSEKLENILRTNGHKDANISSVKGPCLASGLAHKMRTSTVIANENIKKAQEIQSLISTEYYKCEITNDVPGVEFSSAIKNIYSMLIGAAEGLSNPAAPIEIQKKFYLNTSASLIHRSISEMAEFVSYYSGKVETVYGLAGLGDLHVSVAGGRNSKMGMYLGQGYLYKDAKENFMKDTTVEGAQLALEIGPKIMKNFKENQFPLMFSILKCVCHNKKLEINW